MADDNEDQWLYGDSVDIKDDPLVEGQVENKNEDSSLPTEEEPGTVEEENPESKQDQPPGVRIKHNLI